MVQLLKQSSKAPPSRVSELLPSVKCSSCGKPVPLDELGDHTCALAPSVPTLPKPQHSPQSATTLLPPRLQNVATSPHSPSRSPIPSPSSSRFPSQVHDRPIANIPPALGSATGLNHFPEGRVGSPLARSEYTRLPTPARAIPTQERTRTPSAPQRDYHLERRDIERNVYPQSQSSPSSSPLRSYTQMNNAITTTTTRPNNLRNPTPDPPPTRPLHGDIDTKTGGEAGMAGVGRRAFAAASRAAMFANPDGPPPPRGGTGPSLSMEGRRANAPKYLDIEASRPATPPLSPNSNSSQSHSPSPLSPYSQFNGNDRNNVASRSPSPSQYPHVEPTILSASRVPPSITDIPKTPETPLSSALSSRLPFFEKYKNKLPGANADTRSPNSGNIKSPNNAPPATVETRWVSDQRLVTETETRKPTSRPDHEPHSNNRKRTDTKSKRDPSPDSGSDVELAYASSTNNSDEERKKATVSKWKQKKAPPPPLDLPNITGQVEFPSLSQKKDPRTLAKPDGSSSVANGNGSRGVGGSTQNVGPAGRSKLSVAFAPAPELAQVEKNRVYPGGSGVERDRIGSSSGLKGGDSAGSGSAYSKSTGTGTGTTLGGLDRTMAALMEDIANEVGPRSALTTPLTPGSPLTKSKSVSALTTTNNSMNSAGKAQRSNTVSSPESKTPKLPYRSPTYPRDSSRAKDGVDDKNVGDVKSQGKKTSEKKRECVRCENTLEDKRWVRMDGGSVLCEKCWKNMYLPKCRRCNLPIEKQAVSSSDGQLKGKYHRDCFNCNKCHKPFPDKTFYVFDGKPLCAYHYHEANDSLCAAGTCGQPIEGPCAVSHTGDRYHPNHFLCEHPGNPKCRQRLEEYWEVDGRMLCERHANAARNDDRENERDSWAPRAKATKRVTRFIDLAGNGLQ